MSKKLTENEKKALVAEMLIHEAGTLVEFWSEKIQYRTSNLDEVQEVDAEFARKCLNTWLRRLPGASWDIRLGDFEN